MGASHAGAEGMPPLHLAPLAWGVRAQAAQGEDTLSKPSVVIDPEFRDLIPPLAKAELAGLKALLAERGCNEPLTVWKEENILLDGHNRHALCEEMGIEFTTRELSFPDRASAITWVCDYQLGRRNLPPQARADLVLKEEEVMRAAAKERSAANLKKGKDEPESQNSDARGRTDEALAEKAGMSRDTLRKAKAVRERAPKAVHEKARRGEISVNKAFTKAKASAPKKTMKRDKEAERTEPQAAKWQRHWKGIGDDVNRLCKRVHALSLIMDDGSVDDRYVAQVIAAVRPVIGKLRVPDYGRVAKVLTSCAKALAK